MSYYSGKGEKKEQESDVDKIRKIIKVANENPDKLNDEGKRQLAFDIIEELPIKEVDKFIRKFGYNK